MGRGPAFLLPLVPGCALAGAIAISPPRLDITLTGTQAAEAVKVVNLDTNPIRLKVSVAHWRLDEHNRVEVIPPTPQSADQWLLITPLEFVVEPGKFQTLRILVRPRVKPEVGEHRAMIFLDEQPPDTKEFATRNLARIGVGVYVWVPPVERKAIFHCADAGYFQKPMALLDLESTGNAHVRPAVQFVVWPKEKFPGKAGTVKVQESPSSPVVVPAGAVAAGLVPDIPVLPGTRRKIVFPLAESLPAGEYWLDLSGQVDSLPIAEVVPFIVPELPSGDARDGAH
ncbi:MAG: molecular chaperone [Acidobacteriota bacterium]|jgi:hypothetical protein|uniref:Molecular chaperone n=1 Tax=Thermoanaerobaculum aquaticum TaxID=1312852 RepID=A0A062XZD5_9BACT|nr:hypothetical protein EG19_04515 [Thermoanaerobaculum aquaticum]BCW93097.1 MAG: hypothetical protein KatS3mg007_0991 [Thermoanaerobaculum sp.]GBC79849.1 hypothetical protein HRbin09_01076 [bacterium HR09]